MVSGVWYLLHRSWVPCFLRQQSTLSCIYGNLQGILHATDTRLTQATCHTSCKSHSWIQRGMSCQEKFVATKITRPTHLFFYLWDNLKAKVYANNPKALEGQYSEWNWKNWSNLACVASMTTWRRVKKSIHAQGNHFQHQILYLHIFLLCTGYETYANTGVRSGLVFHAPPCKISCPKSRW